METERRDRKLGVPMTRRQGDRFYVDEGIATWHEPTGRPGAINGDSRARARHDSRDSVVRNREVGVICCIGYTLTGRA